ncbi:unnamed protein product [Didymodactylos carnosus]|uniref:Uncharacterized protein n=1 Tax=Didymodactylos carnosus TaxID=1234261 RepID=A0A8S2FRT9_9BILA|nr:unnamed protein product [Didymodactylos carnosus]CAF4335266.1 unnamed protein product [Didymodactylos carnosus]
MKTKDNLDTYNELRASINHIERFNDLQKAEEYIMSVQREKIVLIVSGTYGRELVPRLHDLSQLNCIYVYCFDKARNEEWSKNYTKVSFIIHHQQRCDRQRKHAERK